MRDKAIKILFVIAIMLPVCFDNWGLTESSEGRYAEISREMYVNKDYINPTLLGINHFHKPPITYYITSFSYYIFGVNEFATRFFPAAALLLQVLLCFKITKLLFGDRSLALLATLIYYSYPLVHAAAKNLTTDCFLTTFIFAAVFFYLLFRSNASRNIYLYLFYIFCGLSFLTKGPVGVLPSGLFVISYDLTSAKRGKITLHHFIAFFICILICSSWFVVLLFHNPSLFNYFIKHQLVDRVSNNSFDRSQPFYYYLYVLPLTALPAVFILFPLLRDLFTKKYRLKKEERALGISFLIGFLIFSISSSKLALYTEPLYLFLAILSAKYLAISGEKKLKIFSGIFFYFYLIVLVAVLAMAIFQVKFFLPLFPVATITIAGILMLLLIRALARPFHPLYIVLIPATGITTLALLAPVIMTNNEPGINSIKPVAGFINTGLRTDPARIIVYDQILPSLQFYSNKTVITVFDNNRKAKREIEFESDTSYRQTYFDVADKFQALSLRAFTNSENYCLVVKKDHLIPDSLKYLLQQLPKKKLLGNWIVYYQ